jgi:1-acyl-sn-glycerol-3-phosphate acyltransferase
VIGIVAETIFSIVGSIVATYVPSTRNALLRGWARIALWTIDLRITVEGSEPPDGALVVANHVSYLDPLILGSVCPGSFLAKAEIARWPGIGAVTRASNAVFVERSSARNSRQIIDVVTARLQKGDRVILFPEAGIHTDGSALAAFRPMIFEASVQSGKPVIPIRLRYVKPTDPNTYAWLDNTGLWEHLFTRVFYCERIEVEARIGAPIAPGPEMDRKALAQAAFEAMEAMGR